MTTEYEKEVDHWFLTVGDLKEIIKDIPDDHVVTVVSSETKNSYNTCN